MALGRKTGGRQKGSLNKSTVEIKDLARAYGVSAIERLGALLLSPDDRVAIAACQALLDRGYGKPRQSMDVMTTDVQRPPTEMSEEELVERIRELDLEVERLAH